MSHDIGAALARAICANIVNFMNFSGLVEARPLAQTEWASVTFTGARHHLRVELNGPGAVGVAADFLDVLPELEFAFPDQIVADVTLLAEERRDGGDHAALELEVLTIADC